MSAVVIAAFKGKMLMIRDSDEWHENKADFDQPGPFEMRRVEGLKV